MIRWADISQGVAELGDDLIIWDLGLSELYSVPRSLFPVPLILLSYLHLAMPISVLGVEAPSQSQISQPLQNLSDRRLHFRLYPIDQELLQLGEQGQEMKLHSF